MHLTRMYLNPRRRQTIRFLKDPQALHAAVESSFPPRAFGASGTTDGNGEARLLWRLDVDDHTQLLILSTRVPSLEHLQEQAGWSAEASWETRSYEPLLARLSVGQQYAFRLVANPVHTVTGEDGRKRLFAHVTAQQQAGWLSERAAEIGVRFLDAHQKDDVDDDPTTAILVSARETLRFRRGDQTVTIARARFDGAVEVTDAQKLRMALTVGVGRGKAYGCGLITLAPLGAIAG